MSQQPHDGEYDPKILDMLQLIWGEGFLSPGGPAAVDKIVEGLDLTGQPVVDIGSGLGGVDMHLARAHGARVIGMEIEASLVALAKAKVTAADLSEQIELHHCAPGPLALDDASIHVVFSKDSLIHVEDKDAVFRDCFRVLEPGGWLAMSDWMRGPEPYSKDMEYWFELEGLTYHMWPLKFYGRALAEAGFSRIEVEDTSDDYRRLCDAEYEQMEGPLNARMEAILGAKHRDHFVENWRAMTVVLHKGELRTGRIRARKPGPWHVSHQADIS